MTTTASRRGAGADHDRPEAAGTAMAGGRRRATAAAAGRSAGRTTEAASAFAASSRLAIGLVVGPVHLHHARRSGSSCGPTRSGSRASATTSVFWTRLGVRSGCSSRGTVIALVLLLGNLWLAGRLAPPPRERRRRHTARLARPAERGGPRAEQRSGRARGDPLGRRPARGPAARSTSRHTTCPTRRRSAGWSSPSSRSSSP